MLVPVISHLIDWWSIWLQDFGISAINLCSHQTPYLEDLPMACCEPELRVFQVQAPIAVTMTHTVHRAVLEPNGEVITTVTIYYQTRDCGALGTSNRALWSIA